MSESLYKDIPGIIHIQKKTYAINLLWNQVSLGDEPLKTAKKSAKLINTQLICLKDNLLGIQYGLADRKLGHKRGMCVLATQIDTATGAICAAWEFEHGIWYVFAVNNDGVILLDKGVSNKELAIEEFNNIFFSNDQWMQVICPSDWLIPHSIDKPISSFLSKKKGKKIRTISPLPSPLYLSLFLFIALGLISYFYISEFNSSEYANVQLQPELDKKSKNNKSKKIDIIVPWSDYVKPFSMLTQCITYIDFNVLNAVSVPGWLWNDEVSCDGRNVFFAIEKNGGTNLWLRSASTFISPPPEIIEKTENKAILSWPVHGTDLYKKQNIQYDEIYGINDIRHFLSESFAQSFLAFTMQSSVNVSIDDYQLIKQSFTYTTKLNPGIYLPVLINIDGVVFDNITYSFKSNEWRVSGFFWGRTQ